MSLRGALLRWYRGNRRDLPWRRTRDPYAIWISEAMLQQTRVETVIPYYRRFLERFPDPASLASADEEEVLGQWAGLGYYRRARNLHRAAKVVVERFGGALPDDAEALRGLPGVGRYTAGAVASIAFDRPEPILDGNVTRVLTRLLGIREDPRRPAVAKRLWAEAARLARGPSPGDLNQALMELGATVCTPRAPRCLACPVSRRCAARAAGDAESLPVKGARTAPRRVEATAAYLLRRGRVLTVKRPAGGLLGGLWELPGGALSPGEKPRVGAVRSLREGLGLEPAGLRRVGSVEHVFTHRRMQLHVFRGEAPPGRVRRRGFDAHRWARPEELAALPGSAVLAKVLRLLGEAGR